MLCLISRFFGTKLICQLAMLTDDQLKNQRQFESLSGYQSEVIRTMFSSACKTNKLTCVFDCILGWCY